MGSDTAESVLLAIASDATLPATARLLAAAALAGAGRAGVAPTVIEHDPEAGCDGATTCALYGSGQGPTCQAASRPLWLVRPATDPAPDWCPLRSGGVLVRSPRG